MSHGARHEQAGGGLRNQTEMDERRRKCRRGAGENVVAMKQHGGADADGDAVHRADQRLVVIARAPRGTVVAATAAALSSFEVFAFAKSSRSLPAVKTPEPPEITMLRISGLVCADVMASAIAIYMLLGQRVFLVRAGAW